MPVYNQDLEEADIILVRNPYDSEITAPLFWYSVEKEIESVFNLTDEEIGMWDSNDKDLIESINLNLLARTID